MENEGDTQGTFKKRTDSESEPEDEKEKSPVNPTVIEKTTIEVTVEDLEDDDVPVYISDVKKTLHTTRDTRFESDLTEGTEIIDISDLEQRKPSTKSGPKEPIIKKPINSNINDITEAKETKTSMKKFPIKPTEEKDLEEVTVTFSFERDDKHTTEETVSDTTTNITKNYNTRAEPHFEVQPAVREPEKTKQPHSKGKKTSTQPEDEEPDSSDVTEFEISDHEFITNTREEKYVLEKHINANDKSTIEKVRRSPSPDTKHTVPITKEEKGRSPSPVSSRTSPNKPKIQETLTTRRSPSPVGNRTSPRQRAEPTDGDRTSPSPAERWTREPNTTRQTINRTPSPRKVPSTTDKEPKHSSEPKVHDKSSTRTQTTTDVKQRPMDTSTTLPAREQTTPQTPNDSYRKPKNTSKSPVKAVQSDLESSDIEYISSATEENYASHKYVNTSEEFIIKERRRSPSPLQELTSPSKPRPTQSHETTETKKITKSPKVEPKTSPSRKLSAGDLKQKQSDSSTKPYITDKTPVNKRPTTSKTIDETIIEKNKSVKTSTTINKTTTLTSPSPQRPLKDTTVSGTRKGLPINEKNTLETTGSNRKPRKPSIELPTPTIKDRLRSSPRKQTPKTDNVDANSSPDSSPTRHTGRRRSSNISVHTEIIIEHAGPSSPKSPKSPKSPSHVTDNSPKKQSQTPQKSAPKEIIDSSRMSRRVNVVTERKESAPVQRVTRQENDAKMARSTSENVIKVTATKPTVKGPAMTTLSPKTDRRPNKCFTTKTINLSSTNKVINSEDVDSVVIDIQQAKSSREPSPDKIVPTPVPLHLDTGKPRYPDTVQEPEDEPRKKPVVKNVPIFEEDSNEFLHCHISEISVVKTSDNPEEYLDNPTVEAPQSLEYSPHDKPIDDCLLTVHEKVSKFTHTAEEVKKPKASSPFTREYEQNPKLPENDDCLLTVNQKVDKFLKTAESITNHPIHVVREIHRPDYDQLYEDIRHDECTLSVSQKVDKFINTAEKLAPTTPQKSPELVARVERRISRQSEPEYPDEESDDDTLTPFSENHTIDLELKRQKDILSRPSIWDRNLQNTDTMHEVITISPRKPKPLGIQGNNDEELITSTTKIHSTRRQKEIPTSPSKYEHSKSPVPERVTNHPTYSNLENRPHVDSIARKPAPEKLTKHPNAKISHSPTNTLNKSTKTTTTRVTEVTVEHTPTSNTPDHENVTPIPEQNKRPKTSPFSTGRTMPKTYTPDEENLTPGEIRRPKYSSYTPERTGPVKSIPDNKREPTPATLAQTKRLKASPFTPEKSSTMKNTPDDATSSEHTQRPKTPSVPTGRNVHVTESVSARRNIFENSQPKKTPTPTLSGRRPSYMDHTRSSLEHTRRDSLEINKNNYSRKTSMEDDNQFVGRPNAAVKFDVPQKPRKEVTITDDINIEEIFELEILEELLEIVTSYELRRRIRAQIRLIKKNMHNTHLDTSSNMTSSVQKSYTSTTHKVHHTATDTCSDGKQTMRPLERVYSPTRPHEETMTITDSTYSRTTPERSHSPDHPRKPVEHVYYPTRAQKQPQSETKKPTERIPSPGSKTNLKETRRTSGSSQTWSSKQYTHVEQVDHHGTTEVKSSPRPLRKQPSQTESTNKPVTATSRTPSPAQKIHPKLLQRTQSPTHEYVRERSSSPESKVWHDTVSSTVVRTTNGVIPSPTKEPSRSRSPPKSGSRQTETITTKHTSYRTTTHSPETHTGKPKADDKKPIWMDRKNVLRNPSSSIRSPTATSPLPTPSKVSTSRTTKTTSQRQTKTAQEENSITSSYGIGPTDENGLPLFGIKALKKKKATQPSETTEEVTGYVVEEKYYADNKSKPTVERKEYIYSTNADELEELKHKKSLEDDGVIRKFEKIEKEFLHKPKAIMPDDEEFSSTSARHYVRRGSVKEMSEKFIRKESSQSITEKSNGYPKAGLILRTSRRASTDTGDCFEPTQDVISHKPDSDYGDDYSYAMERSSHQATESESECESVKIQKEFSKKSSTSSTSTRSFLNSTGGSKVVTGVDDVLERMRNADNVVVEGDSPEDQEARALLNKFLGASVIMRGVETSLPPTKETKITTSYTNSDGDKLRKQEVKTTRVTKTIKSGSSSSPVTRTTCDIEEIWDEEILKELLEQAKTYEERRKIRARLRVLMADREAQQKHGSSTSTTEKTETKEKDGAVVTTTTKVTTRTVTGAAPKPVSPFAKFRQLDKQNSLQSQSPKMSK